MQIPVSDTHKDHRNHLRQPCLFADKNTLFYGSVGAVLAWSRVFPLFKGGAEAAFAVKSAGKGNLLDRHARRL